MRERERDGRGDMMISGFDVDSSKDRERELYGRAKSNSFMWIVSKWRIIDNKERNM